jgi:hypothetical protein
MTRRLIQTSGSSALTVTAGPEPPLYPLDEDEPDDRLPDEEPDERPLDPPEYP